MLCGKANVPNKLLRVDIVYLFNGLVGVILCHPPTLIVVIIRIEILHGMHFDILLLMTAACMLVFECSLGS